MADRYRPSTVDALLSAIALAHRAAEKPFDRRYFTPIVEGIKRTHGTVPRQVAAVTVGDLRTMVDALPDTLQGARDRAVLTVGFAGALRCSELVGLDIGRVTDRGVGSITIEPRGARILIGRSKGDQTGDGLSKWLPRGGHPCPVEALEYWLTRAQLRNGAVFRCLRRGKSVLPQRLPGDAVAKTVKRSVYRMALATGASEEQARSRASQACAHSLRVGFVTSAVLVGVPSEDIADHVGWKSIEYVFHYARRGDPFVDNPAGLVLAM
jgi:integrase